MDTKTLREKLYSRYDLLQYILTQRDVQFINRAVDMRWYYKNIVPISVSGFNPLGNCIFYGRHSFLEKILKADDVCVDRDINWFLYEIFFAAHDYMHIWAVQRLLKYFPDCATRHVWEDEDILSDLAFILIVSEVVATVAIDYWLLSASDLSRDLGIEADFRGLTTVFRCEDLDAVRRTCPTFAVRDKGFFSWLVAAYCAGIFQGFPLEEVSPSSTLNWLRREREHSARQKRLVRWWLCYLSLPRLTTTTFPDLRFESGLRNDAIRDVCRELWAICFEKEISRLAFEGCFDQVPLPNEPLTYDFRFNDIQKIQNLHEVVTNMKFEGEQFGYLAAQYVSSFEYADEIDLTDTTFDDLVRNENWSSVTEYFRTRPQLLASMNSQIHIFLPN